MRFMISNKLNALTKYANEESPDFNSNTIRCVNMQIMENRSLPIDSKTRSPLRMCSALEIVFYYVPKWNCAKKI